MVDEVQVFEGDGIDRDEQNIMIINMIKTLDSGDKELIKIVREQCNVAGLIQYTHDGNTPYIRSPNGFIVLLPD